MTADIGAQLRRGVVEYCVLGLLARAPMYGWQLAAALTERGMIASIGTLYPLLARLRARELVRTYAEASASGPTRKYYRITESGSAELAAFRDQWRSYARAVGDIIEEEHA